MANDFSSASADTAQEANPVVVQCPEDVTGIPEPEWIREWARMALEAAPGPVPAGELVVRVVEEEAIAALNQDFRGKEGPTNVLSFPADLPEGPWEPMLGDVVICGEVVRREAADQGKAPEAHWAHMVVHGSLHLLGYDHEEPGEAEVMEDLERSVMARLGFGDPYAEE